MTTETNSPIGRELYAILTERRSVSRRLEVAATDALWIWDLDDRSRRWMSPRFSEALGYPTAEVPAGFSWQDIAEEFDLEEFDGAVDAHIADPQAPIRHTVCMAHALGYDIPVEVFGIAVASQRGGRVDRLIGILIDQTKENRLETLLEQTNSVARIGAWSLDLVTDEVFWTQMVYDIHEIEDSAFVPSVEAGISFYREGYSRERIQEVLTESVRTGGTWDEVLEIVTAKGNPRWVRAVGHVETRGEKAIRLQGSFQDIHEAKLRELAVARSEALLSNYFDLAPHGMIIVEASGRLERVSASFVKMLGYSHGELVGMHFSELTYPEDREEDAALVEQLRLGAISSFRREKRYVRKDGELILGGRRRGRHPRRRRSRIEVLRPTRRHHRGQGRRGLPRARGLPRGQGPRDGAVRLHRQS